MMTYGTDGNKIEHESSAALQGCTDTKSRKGHLMHIKNSLRAVVIPIGPSIAYVPLTQGLYSLIDAADAEWVGRSNWYAHDSKSGFYAQRNSSQVQGKRKILGLHAEILKPGEGFVADHINCNGLDNRRCNLREATTQQNCCNSRIPKNNKSGLKGVYARADKWVSALKINGKGIYLGEFSTPEEAHAAYIQAAKQFHGEFARTA